MITLDELREKARRLASAMEFAWGAASPYTAEALTELDTLIREARAAECEYLADLGRGNVVWLRERAAFIRKGEL